MGPILWLPLNEKGFTPICRDDSILDITYNNTGDVVSGKISQEAPYIDDIITVNVDTDNYPFESGQITVCFWAKNSETEGSEGSLLTFYNSEADMIFTIYNTNTFNNEYFEINDDEYAVNSDDNLITDKLYTCHTGWHHYAVVIDILNPDTTRRRNNCIY